MLPSVGPVCKTPCQAEDQGKSPQLTVVFAHLQRKSPTIFYLLRKKIIAKGGKWLLEKQGNFIFIFYELKLGERLIRTDKILSIFS